jgi:hypothetical protein
VANHLADAYRNSAIGKTSDYSARVDCDTDTLKSYFMDASTDVPVVTDVFESSHTGINPTFANAQALSSGTAGVVGVGVFDAADTVFTGSSVLTGSTSVEWLVVFKFVSAASDSPYLAGWDTATGLPLTPNGGDVTVQWNASGLWRF